MDKALLDTDTFSEVLMIRFAGTRSRSPARQLPALWGRAHRTAGADVRLSKRALGLEADRAVRRLVQDRRAECAAGPCT